MKTFLFVFSLLSSGFTCQRLATEAGSAKNCRQIVIVTSENEATTAARLFCFQKNGQVWEAAFPAFDATFGRSGLAWGKGLHGEKAGRQKKEGDGKSPAGIFTFGKAFGYAPPQQTPPFKLPYIQADQHLECVDDVQSVYYNLLIDNRLFTKDWHSSEFMRRQDEQYKWGVFIEHNTPAVQGAGSCIFFHIWAQPGAATSGCTAMSEENLLKLMGWLDPTTQPLLVQTTFSNYAVLKEKHNFPALPKE